MGAITSTAATSTLAASKARRGQLARARRRIAKAQKKTSNIALARNQHEAPIKAPAPKAHPGPLRFPPRSSIQVAPTTIQLVVPSARGTPPSVAAKAQSPPIALAHI